MIKDKLRIIFLPFFLGSIGLLVTYTLLHWLLFIHLELFHPKEVYTNFIFPGIFCVLFLLLYYARIRLFAKKSWHDFFMVICTLALLAPQVVTQNYLTKQQGHLIEMDTPDKIEAENQVKYYSIEHSYIAKMGAGAYVARADADRYGTKISITVYFVAPLLSEPDFNQLHTHNNWIGVTFKRKFSNMVTVNKEDQRRDIEAFFNEAYKSFQRYSIDTKFLTNLRTDNDFNYFLLAAKNSKQFVGKENIVILQEAEGDYESRTGDNFSWIFYSWLIGNVIWLLIVLFSSVHEGDLELFHQPTRSKKGLKIHFSINRDVLLGIKSYWATSLLVAINTLIFILMLFKGLDFMFPQSDQLLEWGASYGPLIQEGEWWRLLTCTFLHSGIEHLIYNMFSLCLIGFATEKEAGSFRFLLVYLIAGIASSYVSVLVHEPSVGMGASGAIFGMYGLAGALTLKGILSNEMKGVYLFFCLPFLVVSLIVGLLFTDIDMAAHLGGLGAGFVAGLFFRNRKDRRKIRRLDD
ncbi:rhomboid family intramembrane serine protease [Bacteroides sp. 224]|uniref:rhomboid family intramembrane serine protease n=1 Tax=Bacteroides sp. 224 TaxID=2302936 RepID=UPI0013D50894|nr:rhomboid family intramembrane serine protease [Bacteroides sp. 224]NDV64250.1 rhomboid family intramembrane serine protease [Bacteroides sp. 224]